MSFGLCNAPSTFIHFMNDVLHPFLDLLVIVYLDDTLVYSSTWEGHILDLKQVLETLKTRRFLAILNKCEFTKQFLVYL